LAAASGGRLFSARSVEDLDPVYAQVAMELRSVYTLAYYPKNQNFDGRWRRVQVRVKSPGVRVRTRAGYFAR
jgi:Ca-activated chloride channel family protein